MDADRARLPVEHRGAATPAVCAYMVVEVRWLDRLHRPVAEREFSSRVLHERHPRAGHRVPDSERVRAKRAEGGEGFGRELDDCGVEVVWRTRPTERDPVALERHQRKTLEVQLCSAHLRTVLFWYEGRYGDIPHRLFILI